MHFGEIFKNIYPRADRLTFLSHAIPLPLHSIRMELFHSVIFSILPQYSQRWIFEAFFFFIDLHFFIKKGFTVNFQNKKLKALHSTTSTTRKYFCTQVQGRFLKTPFIHQTSNFKAKDFRSQRSLLA